MKGPKQAVDDVFTIFRGLPFYQKFLYNTPSGAKVDLTGKKAKLTMKESADSPEDLFTLDTNNDYIVMGDGFFEWKIPGDKTIDFQFSQSVGHFVIEESPEVVTPLIYAQFNVLESTTGAPT